MIQRERSSIKIILLLSLFLINHLTIFAGDSIPTNGSVMIGQYDQKEPYDSKTNFYIPPGSFTFAGNRMYTVYGGFPLIKTKIKPIPASITTVLLAAGFIVQHEAQQNTIWKELAPFHVVEDGQYTFYLDKGGHFYGTFMVGYLMKESLLLSGFNLDDSYTLAGISGFLYTTYVEINDGMSKTFGFSPSDWYADIGGATYFIAQHYVPFLQNFTPKFMYVYPGWIGEKNRKEALSFIDNYSAQTFWISTNIHHLLPENLKSYWIKGIELAVGYGVYSLAQEGNTTLGKRKIFLGLDYNLVELLPDGCNLWNWFRQGLVYFRLPAPTLEIGINGPTRFYLVYPFPINIGKLRF